MRAAVSRAAVLVSLVSLGLTMMGALSACTGTVSVNGAGTGGNGSTGSGGSGPVCAVGLTLCSGSCANATNDANHCGGCGMVCASGQVCDNGACATTCSAGAMLCGASCANVSADPAHCGNCTTMCRSDQTCSGGACVCPTGQSLCNGVCAASCGGGGGNGGGAGTGGAGPPATDPGRITVHRLNRAEYNNTVADLLGTTTRPADDFPIDDRGNGFDNVADILSLSPLHISTYDTAATALVDQAMANTTQRARIFTCNLTTQGATCARTALQGFVPKAWRRPVTTAEIDGLMTAVTLATTNGDTVEVGLKLALRAVLLSPNFVFRIEVDSPATSMTPHPVSPYEMASRLSYFLWSTMPDDTLFAEAAANRLGVADMLTAQVNRMLASPKAQALIDNFGGQWLYTRAIAEVAPDATLFPGFDAPLRTAMKAETDLLLRDVVLAGLPADKLLTADFAYLNDRLARHYGLPATGSATSTKVSLTGNAQRGGFLSQAGILTVTSHQTRTSPVLRGKWVLNELLCQEIPAPPPDIPMIDDGMTATGTLRQRLEQHATKPECAVCHVRMDPIGFGLENYDPIGVYRTMDAGATIDSSGKLPDGRQFSGPKELSALIASDPGFSSCLTQKLYTFALGRAPDLRTPGHLDGPTVQTLAAGFRSGGFNFKDLITRLVTSPTFMNRRGEP